MRGTGRGVAITTVGNLTAPLAALVSAPVLAQALGAAGRGELAAAMAPLMLAVSGLTLGLPEAVTYAVARQPWRRRRALAHASALIAIAGLLGSLAIALVAPALSGGDHALGTLILLTGFALSPTLLLSSLRGFARGRQAWGLIAIEQLLGALIRLGAIVSLAMGGALTAQTAAFITVSAALLGGLAYLGLLRRPAPVSSPNTEEPPVPLLRFGIGVWVGSVAGVLLARLDQVLILPLAGAEALGVYAVAVSIAEVVRVFNKAVRDVVFAEQSEENDDARLAQASRVSTMITTIAAVVVFALAVPLVPWLFGSEFLRAVPVIGIILLGTVIGNPGSVVAAGMSARGKPLFRSIAILCGVGINVVALLVLVPPLAELGAALASALGNGITGWIVLWFANRFFGLRPRLFLQFEWSDAHVIRRSLAALGSKLRRRRT